MGIPSYESLAKKSPKLKGKAKKEKFAIRYDPDTLEKRLFDLTDAEEAAEAADWLTATQMRSAKSKKEGATDGFGRAFAKSLGQDLSRKLTSKRTGRGTTTRLAGRLTKGIASPGISALSKALPIALRLSGVAAAVGALWYLGKSADDRKRAKLIQGYAANQEAHTRRPLTDKELAAYIPIWEKEADKTLNRERIYGSGLTIPKTR